MAEAIFIMTFALGQSAPVADREMTIPAKNNDKKLRVMSPPFL
jgi:hypothetical protein